jgi:hypothetical protein
MFIPRQIINTAGLVWLSSAASFIGGPLFAATAQLPQAFVDTNIADTPVTGNSIPVNAGDDLQAAINKANPGDEIVLQAGATFTGNYSLPNKGVNNGWVTIRSSQLANLPAPGTRVNPSMAAAMPKIVAAGSGTAFAIQAQANHYRLIGLEITVAPGTSMSFGLIMSGDPSDTNVADLPDHIIFDRDYVHGSALCHCKFGAQMNGTNYAVVDSYFSDFHAVGQDASAIFAYITPGPLKLVNNELEGSAENVIFGGAYDAIPGIVPSDIEIRNNHFYKPLSWMNGIVPAPSGVNGQLVGGGSLNVGTTYYYAIVALGTGDTFTSPGSAQSSNSQEVSFTPASGQQSVSLSWNGVTYGDASDTRTADGYVVLRTTDAPSSGQRNWVSLASGSNLSFTDNGGSGQGWNGGPTRWDVKNLLEVKNGQRILVDGNVFENNWAGADQNGWAILLTPRVESGPNGEVMTQNTARDITFTNNVVQHSGAGVQIFSEDPSAPSSAISSLQTTERLNFSNNLFDDINGSTFGTGVGTAGTFLDYVQAFPQLPGITDATFDHNTLLFNGYVALVALQSQTGPEFGGFTFTNNILPNNQNGVQITNEHGDASDIRNLFTQSTITGNVWAGAPEAVQLPGNFYPNSLADIGFVNLSGGNIASFSLSLQSPFEGLATDGKNPGVNLDALNQKTASAIGGVPTATAPNGQ